jgi:hypothetical protein
MINKKKGINPFLMFLPFLLLYTLIALIFPTTGTFGDESRYLMYANHLLNGFYSPPPPNIDLGNGPGYPIILIPFIALHLPLISVTILNGIFYYLSIVFLFKALKEVASIKLSIIIVLFWGCYINLYEYIPIIYTESFTVFLITLIAYFTISSFKFPNQKKYIYICGFLIGYLALTKPIFGYVLSCILIGILILGILNKKNLNYRRCLFILLIAMIVTTPYLIYNYSLTNKLFYWGSNGGNNFYWMSSPYEGEYGNWIEYPVVSQKNRIEHSKLLIEKNHQNDFQEAFNLSSIDRDSLFKTIAIENIKNHPRKFLINCFSNIGRMLFNFPYSYKLEKPETLLRLPFNGLIILFLLFSIIPITINWKKINFSLKFLLFFAFLYLGGSVLGSAETRMFTIIVPILLIFIAYTIDRCLKINLKID